MIPWLLNNAWQLACRNSSLRFRQALESPAEVQKKILQTQKTELEKQLQLQVSESFEQRKVAEFQCVAANETEQSAREAFRIITKKYNQNSASQIEFIAARNRLTTAELSSIICRHNLSISQAQLEKTTATFPIEDYIIKEEN